MPTLADVYRALKRLPATTADAEIDQRMAQERLRARGAAGGYPIIDSVFGSGYSPNEAACAAYDAGDAGALAVALGVTLAPTAAQVPSESERIDALELRVAALEAARG